jgi:hypothetical protein
MKICSRSAGLISPRISIITGVQDSAARANPESFGAGRCWESDAFYRLIEE